MHPNARGCLVRAELDLHNFARAKLFVGAAAHSPSRWLYRAGGRTAQKCGIGIPPMGYGLESQAPLVLPFVETLQGGVPFRRAVSRITRK